MLGAEAIIECLKAEGVELVFGYPGGSVLTLYDALFKANFPHILTRHEQGAFTPPMVMRGRPAKPGFVLRLQGLVLPIW
jgi:glyoxylate carboligase